MASSGPGPVTVAVPLRPGLGRALPVIASEDALAAERMGELLAGLGLTTQSLRIPVDGGWTPRGDVVAICGPKSSSVTARVLDADPHLRFGRDNADHWVIEDKASGRVLRSPLDDDLDASQDISYIGRLPVGSQTMFVVAGIHALGSLGAVHYLVHHHAEVYAEVGDACFSMVVRSSHQGESVLASEVVWQPQRHP